MEIPESQRNNAQMPPSQHFEVQQQLPNSTAIMVLGILSIVICWCYGLVGLILGIIALVLSGKARELYFENPDRYTISSFNNMKAGRIMSIIGICLSGLYLIIVFIYLIILGAAFSLIPWEMYNSF